MVSGASVINGAYPVNFFNVNLNNPHTQRDSSSPVCGIFLRDTLSSHCIWHSSGSMEVPDDLRLIFKHCQSSTSDPTGHQLYRPCDVSQCSHTVHVFGLVLST